MNRMAKEVMNHQIEAITQMDIPNILNDYSQELVAIAYLCGNTKVVGFKSLNQLVESLIQLAKKLGLSVEKSMKKMKILYQVDFESYAVIAVQIKPFVPFAVFSCAVFEGKANYVTGYEKTIKLPALGMKNELIEIKEEIVILIEKHFKDLKEKNNTEIMKNYSVDAVVLSNFSTTPFVGINQVREYCTQFIDSSSWMDTLFSTHSIIKVKETAQDLVCIAILNKQTKRTGIMTLIIKEKKIVFESSILLV